jgi:hypothetical protein
VNHDRLSADERWIYRDALIDHAERLVRIAENLSRMAQRGQDRLALGSAYDLSFTVTRAMEIARTVVAMERSR